MAFPPGKKKKSKFVPLDLGAIPQPKPAAIWAHKPAAIMVDTAPVAVKPGYIGPPLNHGPIAGTGLHLEAWIDMEVRRAAAWCNALAGGGYPENQGPSYPHVVTRLVYDEVRGWWEAKGTVSGPNGKVYSCSATDPSEKAGRTLQVGASVQGNILATTSKAPYQTRLNLHIDIA